MTEVPKVFLPEGQQSLTLRTVEDILGQFGITVVTTPMVPPGQLYVYNPTGKNLKDLLSVTPGILDSGERSVM